MVIDLTDFNFTKNLGGFQTLYGLAPKVRGFKSFFMPHQGKFNL